MAFEIQGPAGRLEALIDDPAWDCHTLDAHLHEGPRAAVVLAHPLPPGGGTMHNKVVYQLAKGFWPLRRWPRRDGGLPGCSRLHGGPLP
jgi:alpha/beta superfamily hydrolase